MAAILKMTFSNENGNIFVQILLKYIPKDPTNKNPKLAQMMTWHQTCDKPLFETMMA